MESVVESVRGHLVRSVQNDTEPNGRQVRAYLNVLAGSAMRKDHRSAAAVAALLFDPASRERWREFSGRWVELDLDRAQPAPATRMFFEGSWLTLAVGLYPSNEADYATTMKCFYQLLNLCRDR